MQEYLTSLANGAYEMLLEITVLQNVYLHFIFAMNT